MTVGLKFDTWYEYYDSRLSSSVINKGKMEGLLKAFDSSPLADEAKAAMTRNTLREQV